MFYSVEIDIHVSCLVKIVFSKKTSNKKFCIRTNGESANSHVTIDVNMSQNHKTLNIKYVK